MMRYLYNLLIGKPPEKRTMGGYLGVNETTMLKLIFEKYGVDWIQTDQISFNNGFVWT
jgi:hypothetical protein